MTRALNAQKEIEGKSGKDEVGLQTDYSDDDADADPNEADDDEDGAAGNVKREVKDEEAGGKQGRQTKKSLKAGLEDTVKVEKDCKSKKKGRDEDMSRRRNGTAAATDALVGFREYVSPEREARRNAAAMQMMQVDFLQNETARLQSEIQQLRDRIDTLRDTHFREVTQLNNTIIQERERANRAETELRLVQMQLQMGMGMGMMGIGMGIGGYPRFGGYAGSRGEMPVDDRRRRRSPSPLERYSSPAKRPRTRSRSPEKSETGTAVEVTLSPSKGSPSRRLSVKMDSLN